MVGKVGKLLIMIIIPGICSGINALAMPDERKDTAWKSLFLCQEYLLERKFDLAEKSIRASLRTHAGNPVFTTTLAHVLQSRGRDEEAKQTNMMAERQLEQAPALERLLFDVLFAKPYLSAPEKQKVFQARIAEYAVKYPDDYLYYLACGYYYRDLLDLPNAVRHLERALEIAPWLSQAHNLLGYFYTYLNEYPRAIEHLKAYAELYPECANPHDSLGEIFFMTGQYDLSVAEFRTALQLAPSFSAAQTHLINALNSTGKFNEAIKFTQSLWENAEADEHKARAMRIISDICIQRGDYERALEKAEASIQLTPKHPYSYYFKLLALMHLGRMDEFWEYSCTFKDLLRNTKSRESEHELRSNYLYLIGRANLAQGNIEMAIQMLWKANNMNSVPHNTFHIKKELGEAYFAAGKPEKALSVLSQVLDINPSHPPSLLLQAKILASLSRPAEAKTSLSRCLAILKGADRDAPLKIAAQKLASQLK